MVHSKNKGRKGEQDVANLLRHEIYLLMHKHQYDDQTMVALHQLVQRNQNQSAVGGGDISCFGLAFEVKRQETLAIPEWWRQAEASAARNNEAPILIYRQNNKAWHVVMNGFMALPGSSRVMSARVTIDIETFKVWFSNWAEQKIAAGEIDRI